VPDSEEDKGYNIYDDVYEDPASASSITPVPESMDSNQDYSEDSHSNSVASQHAADGEDVSSSSHHGADGEDDHPYQEMSLMSRTVVDKHTEDVMFESNTDFPPYLQLQQSQSTSSNSSTSLKFPFNNNCRETDNNQDNYEIFMFVK
ncbi:hypothetical protein N332_05146, partial [Mesitornis unicolor]